MGFRTIVALSNDLSSDWGNDPNLGRKISALASYGHDHNGEASVIGLTLVECTHADTQSLIIADGYSASPITYSNWHKGQTNEARDLELLKNLAAIHGYRISKIPKKV